ncbi:MAG: BatA domain-containing protein [Gemmatimonadota bacterium]
MRFLAPGWLLAGVVGALLVAAIHFLARRHPRPFSFPTARFIPERPASAAALARSPSDLLLLLLRSVAVLLLGAAFAQPVFPPPRHTALIAIVDRSPAVSALDDSTAALISSAERVVDFDSAISSGLISAFRAAGSLRRNADSVDLLIVSSFAREQWDAATLVIARVWPGGIRLRTIAPVVREQSLTPVSLSQEDPLSATLALTGPLPAGVRVRRQGVSAGDSTWAREGGAVVVWPDRQEHSGWMPRPADTASAVAIGEIAVVAPFVRTVSLPPGRVIARWNDGSPAAVERPLGRGCQRDVAIPVTPVGDLVLRPSVVRLTRRLLAACGGRQDWSRVSDALLDSLRGPAMLASTASLPRGQEERDPARRVLLGIVLVLLVLETVVRRRRPTG